MAQIPTPAACAALNDAALHRLWAGLGYYRRAQHLRDAARALAEQHNGTVPADPAALRALPGFGPYTTGAVAAIAFGLPFAAVDGNVARVWARVHGVQITPDAAVRQAAPWAAAISAAGSPSQMVQALMELGATVCKPRRADCAACPLAACCTAATWPDPTVTPEARRRTPRPVEQLMHLWLVSDARLWLERRPRGLLGERPAPPVLPHPGNKAPPRRLAPVLGPALLEAVGTPFRHEFTHRIWEVRPVRYRLTTPPATPPPGWTVVSRSAARQLGLPAAFLKGAGVLD